MNPIECPRCNSFIGDIGELEECPICGYIFEEEKNEQKEIQY